MNITNIKYTVDGLLFDAAVDWYWQMHLYEMDCFQSKQEDVLPIELYCCDIPEWDVHMMYQNGRRDVDFDNIIKETKAWIKEMKK